MVCKDGRGWKGEETWDTSYTTEPDSGPSRRKWSEDLTLLRNLRRHRRSLGPIVRDWITSSSTESEFDIVEGLPSSRKDPVHRDIPRL